MEIVESLAALTARLEESELEVTVISVIGMLVDCVGAQIAPLVPPLMGHFGTLWQQAELHGPVRPALLTVLSRLVYASGDASVHMHETIFPLIAFACSGTEDAASLGRDGVLLWLSAMRNLPVALTYEQCSPQLHQVLSYAMEGLYLRSGAGGAARGGETGSGESGPDELRDQMLVSRRLGF